MCTLQKHDNIFILTFTGDNQHRLNPNLITALQSAISQAKSQSSPGSVLITTGHGKFFSNGFDLDWAQASQEYRLRLRQMVNMFKVVVADLISLPMPTIAAVTGHAAAAGMLLAMSHDYILMRSDRGVLYMSEVDIGLPFPKYCSTLFMVKVAFPAVLRDVLLNGAKVKAEEAVAMGLIESAHEDGEKTVEAAVRLAEKLGKRKWDGEVYGEIRKSLYPELCSVLGLDGKVITSSRL